MAITLLPHQLLLVQSAELLRRKPLWSQQQGTFHSKSCRQLRAAIWVTASRASCGFTLATGVMDEERHPEGIQDEEEDRSFLLSTVTSVSVSLSSFGTVAGIRASWAAGYAEPAPAAGYTGETQAPCRPHWHKVDCLWTFAGWWPS